MRKIFTRWGNVPLILLLLAGVTLGARQSSLTLATVDPNNLNELSLAGYHRLLVLAPHCDDETLGTGGLIQAAERAGIQVRVVIATNGDGYFFATAQNFRKVYPHRQDYIRMGEMRQRESLAALAVLGVQPGQVSFLSYPDRGSPSMWYDNWSPDHPYRSPYSSYSKSPYPLTYDPKSVYAGADYLADLETIITDFRPDLIVYPHPEDVHPDHWGLSVFTRLAITLIHHNDPTYRPTEYTYLVHRPDFPVIRGYQPQESLTPPPALFKINPDWYRLDLTSQEVGLKDKAVTKYRSQLPLLRKLMESFIRQNELFAPVADAVLPDLTQGSPSDPSTWIDGTGSAIRPIQLDPVDDILTHNAIPATDLVGVYVAREASGNLLACSEVREETVAEITYAIRLKALTDKGIVAYSAETGEPQAGWHLAKRSGVYACISVSLSELGDPWAIFVGAATEGLDRITLDQSAWQMVVIGGE
ncbi:MAG TPA: PIG-L family deacetylase [Anaerolineales bacterium]|nr:PIG-L family deacetylase [Anaerolineales bacterium]